ncbi:laccase, multicopper oxidase, benzenediol:oxygen oxidorectuctase [Marasmius sp. AFHP31]|nr:laccase, multicopper oxidase, benzenediol:oxygen oxidorectuctase [Marasmius sp. AFHP31]
MVIDTAVVAPDGFSRTAVLAGGTIVGPLITAQKGERIKVNVINNLDHPDFLKSTSIHWHGFFQNDGANWADGPAFVNQCPIAHKTSFLYDYPTGNQAGTFWYHSHLSTQYCDGLRGVIVVYDPEDPFKSMYDVDDDTTVISLTDWYHTPAKQLELPTHDSVLINGLGRWKDGGRTDLAVIQVEQGKRYRFRFVNTACQPDFVVNIDNHDLTIIEADSINHNPVTVDSFQIFVGQRYSAILNANQPVGNYWIHADPSSGDKGFNGGINSAILRYVGAPESEPTTDFRPRNPLKESDLHPHESENPGAPGEPFPGGVDHAIHLHFSTSSNHFAVNDVEFESPSLPVLLQVLNGEATSPQSLMPKGSVYELPVNSTIEISMSGGGVKGFDHPIHLHGHAFDVVRVAGSDTYNYANPVRRDVVRTGNGGDNVTFRFRTDNPGPWFLHCHIDWHLEVGFAVVFAERVPEWETAIHPPDAWKDLCPTYAALGPDEI